MKINLVVSGRFNRFVLQLKQMTRKQAKQKGYTHYGSMYGIPGYINLNDDAYNTFTGKYLLTDLLAEAISYLDQVIGFNPHGFKLTIKGEL